MWSFVAVSACKRAAGLGLATLGCDFEVSKS